MSEKKLNIPNTLGLRTIIPNGSRIVRYDLTLVQFNFSVQLFYGTYFIFYVVLQVKLTATLEGGSRKQMRSTDKEVDKLHRVRIVDR